MARASFSGSNPQPAPDSPRSSESPPPSGLQGDLEGELLNLANALYNLGTTVVNDLTKEKDKQGGKPVGSRVNEVVKILQGVDQMSMEIPTMIPKEVLAEIDNSRNPMQLTRDRLERAATENQFMNGKIQAVKSYRTYYNEALIQSFPDLAEYLTSPGDGQGAGSPSTSAPNGNGTHG